MIFKTPAPPIMASEERDYRSVMVAAVRRWRVAALAMLQNALTVYRDGWVDDVFSSIRSAWFSEEPAITSRLKPFLFSVAQRHRRWWVGLIAKRTGKTIEGIDPLLQEPWLAEELNSRLKSNVRLIKNIGETTALQIEEIVKNGVRSGTQTNVIIKQIKGKMDATEYRAKLIAQDQIAKHAASLNQIRQQEGSIDKFEWSTSLDKRVRPLHQAREGKVFNWSDPPPDGHPGQPVRCRCTAIPIIFDEIYGQPTKKRPKQLAA